MAARLNSLPAIILQNPTPDEEAEFLQQLERYGTDQPLIYSKATQRLLDSHYPELKRYLLESQRPNAGLDDGIQARVRSLGDAADREQMCRQLIGWLRDRSAAPPHREVITVGKNAGRHDGVLARVADMLADWAYGQALPLLDSLAADTTLSENARASVAHSVRRLRDPCAFGFLVPDGHGGIRVCERQGALIGMKFVSPRTKECATPLDSVQVAHLWSLIQHSREGIHARWFEGGWGIHLEFRNGLTADLSPTESGWFNYHDSSKGGWWSRTIQNPALFEAVGDCLPAREFPEYK